MAVQIRDMLYEGKAKQVFATEDPSLAVIRYKDDATAQNGLKRGTIDGKGSINNRMSNQLFRLLQTHGVPTHLVEQLTDRDVLVRRAQIVPVEVIVRNVAAGSLSARIGYPEGTVLTSTVLEYCYKNDELGDPMINETHIQAMGLATREEMQTIEGLALKINDILTGFFAPLHLTLIDFKLEFGRAEGGILLADEISPDTCRFWDTRTGEKLDKDRFRRDLGGVEAAYAEVQRRLDGALGGAV